MTDDQLALVGCLLALLASGLTMTASYPLGRFFRGRKAEPGPHTLPVTPNHPATATADDTEDFRRAA